MSGKLQRTVAVWAVLTVPFALVAGYLWSVDELTVRFVAAYWFGPAVLTAIGAIPVPWRIRSD